MIFLGSEFYGVDVGVDVGVTVESSLGVAVMRVDVSSPLNGFRNQ